MDANEIALLSLVLALVAGIVGSFAYLMGEIRKTGTQLRHELSQLRDYVLSQLQSAMNTAATERSAMRAEFINANNRVESDLRKLNDVVVRRDDMLQVESRLNRSSERLERKVDQLQTRFPYRGGSPLTPTNDQA